MKIPQAQITSFMAALGLMQDQASQICQRARGSNNYTEELLSVLYPVNVHLPGTTGYSDLIDNSFGSRSHLNASAVFVPETTDQVASVVKILEFFQTQFAVRGLGYTSHPKMASIENGVLVALENMTDLSLSPSKEVVSLGPGNSWGRVYEALEKEGRAVTGGELGVVGVAGLLTGNGVSPFLGSRGFSSADVVNFEVVLAGGKIVNANATSNEDLWWALKGGSNNFGIVTRFDMNTFSLPNGVWAGTISYSPSQLDAALGAYYDIHAGPLLEDPHLTVTCTQMIIPSFDYSTIDILPFTDNLDFNGSYPAAIKPLLDIEPISSTMDRKNLTTMATEPITTEFMQSYTARINRANINVKADKELYKEITKLFFSHYQNSDIDGHTAGLPWNPVTPRTVREANGKGGNPGGWQEVNQISLNLRTTWNNAADDAAAILMDDEFMAKATELARQRDALMPNQWLNNAGENMDVMKSYGSDNYQKLKSISDKYDKKKTFQKLCPGGYKLGA